MSKTTRLGLTLTDLSDSEKTFLEYRTELSGTETNSNMHLIDTAIQQVEQQLTSPFKIKGTVASVDALSGIENPEQNDTYYVSAQGVMARYSYVEETDEWVQSSMSEANYTGALAQVRSDLSTLNTFVGGSSLSTTANTVSGAIVEHENDISGIKSDVADAKNDIENLDESVSTLQSDVTTLEETSNQFSDDILTLQGNVNDVADAIDNAFEMTETEMDTSSFSTGAIDTDGNEQTSSAYENMSYCSVSITNERVGRTIHVEGTAWYMIQPYVFVGSGGEIVTPGVESPGGTVTQYSNLEFVPTVTGTLYINRHGSRSARAWIYETQSLKDACIPSSLTTSISSLQSTVNLNNYQANVKFAVLDNTIGTTQLDTTATTLTGAIAELGENIADVSSDIEGINTELDEIADSVGEVVNSIAVTNQAFQQAFDTVDTTLSASSFSTGIIDTNGEIQTGSTYESMSYCSIEITSNYIGKNIHVTGTAWYMIQPYVFLGSGNSVITPEVASPGSTATQYTLVFTPQERGTLYINRYGTNEGKAWITEITNLKTSRLPTNIMIYDTTQYTQVSLTMTDKKLLNGNTGEITDASNEYWKVSDYVSVTPNTYLLISTDHFYGWAMYAFYDANKVFISGRNSDASSQVTYMRNERVQVPSNAAYVVIGFLYQPSFTAPTLLSGVQSNILPSQRWSGIKWACIGDSLTESYGVTDVHYFEYISAATGIDTVNLGVSGGGYAKGDENFMTKGLLVSADTDVVTIFGSGNDASSGLELGVWDDTGTTTIAGCINTTLDNVFSVNPIIPLGVITPTPWVGNMPSNNGFMEEYSNLIVEICNKRSIPCLDLFHCSNLNPNSEAVRNAAYSKDSSNGVHIDENGHRVIAARIRAFLDTLIL